MAKKKTNKGKVGEMDLDDLGGLEDDFDLGGLEDIDVDRKPSVSGVAKELAEEGGKGFLEGLVKSTAKKSLPDSYENNYSEAMDYVDFGKEMAGQSKSKIQKSIYGLGKEVKKILPFQSKMLNDFMSKYEEDNVKQREMNEEAMREASISGSIAGIFDKQLEVQKAMQARTDAKDEVNAKQEMVTTKLQTDIFTSIDRNIAQQSAFTVQIGKEYYRKSLELQYKSYYVQADLLRHTKDYFKGFTVQLDSVVKNTGLPDYVKLNNMERLGETIRNKAMEGIEQKLFSNNKYVQGIKKRMGAVISDKISGITDKIDGATDALGSMSSVAESPAEMAKMIAGVLSGTAGGTLGSKLAGKIPKKYTDKVLNNKYVQGGASNLTNLANSPRSYMAAMRRRNKGMIDKYEADDTPRGMFGRFFHKGAGSLLDVTRAEEMGGEIKDTNVLSHNKPAIFDNKVHRSITEVIPLYLSRILKENTDLRSMYSSVNSKRLGNFTESETQVYNYQDRKLSTVSDYKKSIEKEVLATSSNKNKVGNLAGSIISDSKAELGKRPGNKDEIGILGGKNSKELLAKYLEEASKMEGVDQDYATLIGTATSKEGNARVTKLVDETPGLKELLTAIGKGTTEANKENFKSKVDDVKNRYPTAPVISLFEQAAVMAGSKFKNKLSSQQAEIISKAFSTFSHNPTKFGGSGDVVLMEDIADGRFTRSIPKADIGEVKDALSFFINNVVTIANSGDFNLKQTLDALIGAVANAVDKSINVSIDVLQTIRELSPELIEKGHITNRNMIEGSLSMNEDIEFTSAEEAKGIGRTTKLDLSNKQSGIVSQIADLKVFQSLGKRSKDLKEKLSSTEGGPMAKAKIILEAGKEVLSEGRKELTKVYASATKKAEELKKLGSELSKELTAKGVTKFKNKLGEYSNEVNKLIEKEKTTTDEAVKALEDLKTEVDSVLTDTTRDFDREIKTIKAMSAEKVKILQEIKVTLDKTRLDIDSRIETSKETVNAGAEVLAEKAKTFRQLLVNTVDELKVLMSKAEAIDKGTQSAT